MEYLILYSRSIFDHWFSSFNILLPSYSLILSIFLLCIHPFSYLTTQLQAILYISQFQCSIECFPIKFLTLVWIFIWLQNKKSCGRLKFLQFNRKLFSNSSWHLCWFFNTFHHQHCLVTNYSFVKSNLKAFRHVSCIQMIDKWFLINFTSFENFQVIFQFLYRAFLKKFHSQSSFITKNLGDPWKLTLFTALKLQITFDLFYDWDWEISNLFIRSRRFIIKNRILRVKFLS